VENSFQSEHQNIPESKARKRGNRGNSLSLTPNNQSIGEIKKLSARRSLVPNTLIDSP